MGNGEVTEPDATRSFSMTLPLTDGAKGETLRFHAQGFAFTQRRRDGTADPPRRRPGDGQGHPRRRRISTSSRRWQLPASPATTYQLSAAIELHQHGGTGGDGYLNILAIDVEIT